MRARTLKPEFFRDRKIAQLGPSVALVYQALWNLADDYGTAPCDPVQVKGEMFVYWSSIGVPEISGALRHLSGSKRVVLFMVGDQLYARIPSWDKHQHPHKPSKFRHPTKGEGVMWDGDVPVPHSDSTAPALPTSFNPVVLESYPTATRTDGEVAFLGTLPPEKRGTWERIFDGWRQGLGTPGMKPFTDEDISVGLLEYLAKTTAPDFSPQHVVTFPAGVKERRERVRILKGPQPVSDFMAGAEEEFRDAL